MQISSRFTIAVHMLICMEVFKEEYKVTSEFLAGSIQVKPVMVRRLLQQLKKAGIIEVKRGSGGATIARPLEQITLLDIYNAVEPIEEGKLFHFHENPNPHCPVGKNIHNILDTRLDFSKRNLQVKNFSFFKILVVTIDITTKKVYS